MTSTFKQLLLGAAAPQSTAAEIAYALFRFYCGISIALGAGLSKIFHKIDEAGGTDWANLAFGIPDWFVKQVGDIGFTFISPEFWAYVAAYGEFVGGLLIAAGLLTRLSALQMAFQFFVVAFIWYKSPTPFAMYYQQLIFWSFVLIAVQGGGRFSIDTWWRRERRVVKVSTVGLTTVLLLGCVGGVSAQTDASAPKRVSFSISNGSLQSKTLEIRCFDYTERKRIGYGCRLGGWSSRSDNKPVGTRIYVRENGKFELKYVLSASDDGRNINIARTYNISTEQLQQVAEAERNEQLEIMKDQSQNPDIESVARSLGLEMVDFKMSGKQMMAKKVYVRIQLPYLAERSTNGFCRKLSRFDITHLRYPAGTKIYLCEGPYWNGPVAETLVLTVGADKKKQLYRI